MVRERSRAESLSRDFGRDLANLKSKLSLAEVKLASLEPRAEQALQLECEINDLKNQIRRLRNDNELLASTNELQAKIIKSRSSSPVATTHTTTVLHTSRPCSPTAEFSTTHTVVSRSASPVYCPPPSKTYTTTRTVVSRSASPIYCPPPSRTTYTTTTVCVSEPPKPSALSPLSPNNCTQVIRQESLINRFNNLYCRDRNHAIETLKCYTDDCDNIKRIIFAAVQVRSKNVTFFSIFYLKNE